jgi:ribosomal protein L11 methyltransferase
VNYLEISIELNQIEFVEILEAELMELPFESFDSDKTILRGYVQEPNYNADSISAITDAYIDQIKSIETRLVEHANWNAVWESNYPHVQLGDELFIGASFHEIPQGFRHYITLEPNMSFGTGHHPTTTQVLEELFTCSLESKKVLDFGCGSGVLAIYAAQRGASGIGIEIDPHAADAARDNLNLNNVNSFKILTGGIEKIDDNEYQYILANINRNVIQECLPHFIKYMEPGCKLICSGFLVSDVNPLSSELIRRNLSINKTSSKEDWAIIVATKPE